MRVQASCQRPRGLRENCVDLGLNGCSPLGDFPAPFGPINVVFKQATRKERQLRGWWGGGVVVGVVGVVGEGIGKSAKFGAVCLHAIAIYRLISYGLCRILREFRHIFDD